MVEIHDLFLVDGGNNGAWALPIYIKGIVCSYAFPRFQIALCSKGHVLKIDAWDKAELVCIKKSFFIECSPGIALACIVIFKKTFPSCRFTTREFLLRLKCLFVDLLVGHFDKTGIQNVR